MTVLNYLLTDEAVYVLTDTLLSDPDDLSPGAFTTKIHAGTGHAQAIAEWVPLPGFPRAFGNGNWEVQSCDHRMP